MSKALGKALIVAALAVPACHTMVPLTFEGVAAERPGTVYITREDQTTLALTGPQVFGDTIVGYVGPTFHELDRDDVSRVEIKRSAKGKTMALVAASIAGAAALGVVISGLGSDSPLYDCNDEPERPECQGQGL